MTTTMATQDELNDEWVRMAPAWIREARHGLNLNRTALLDGPVLEACGDVGGVRALDCGCGEGRFSRILADHGAEYVLGIDLCPTMVEAALELGGHGQDYRLGDVQTLGDLEVGSFDLCVSYLNQCDLPDFMANNREVFRLLGSGGRFVVANLHPMRSADGGWCRTEGGEKRHAILDDYFDEAERRWRMMGSDLTNFHRSLSTYVRGFLTTGFVLADLVEPTVSDEQVKRFPQLSDEKRVPNFIVYVLTKP